ncbi:glycosyltransferase family 9 protein [Vibrio ulleungensis]|uniref:Glycosyltransferase family 9 protein n=1 Tax=Vibrio ulleungensis TaxID=2807619 RepID=A0ABS2HKP8_9VIBR|nr:glycosyltransferase family 9 protein [Vibrio ulleungensis]MBM7037676.1 glycosyltransferase family 9 protein [Vibrio ulleungensis]
MPLFKTAPNAICILRLSAVGDVCNTIAMAQMIQRQWPSTRITWVTGKLEQELLQGLEGIRVVVFDKKQGSSAYRSLWAELANERFDALLHCQYALRASIATLGIKARFKLGFDRHRSQDFQTLFTNHKVPSPIDKPHVLDGLLAFAQELGVQLEKPCWDLNIDVADKQWADKQLLQQQPNLVIVPGASKAYKNWHSQGYAQIIEHASSKGWKITLAGSPSPVEQILATEIVSKTSVAINNIVGKSTLKQMLALLKGADLVIAPDTGPTHMANAVGTPVIGLYAHHNPERTGPYYFRDYVVSAYQQALVAEGRSKAPNWRTRVKDPQAMNRIVASDVINMFDRASLAFNIERNIEAKAASK